MITLREEHLQVFEQPVMERFEARAIVHLRTNLPTQTAGFSDDQLRIRIRDGYGRARPYGFESERQVMCFVDAGFLIGPDFDSRPDTAWTRTVLKEPSMAANQRAFWLLKGAEQVSQGRKPQRVVANG